MALALTTGTAGVKQRNYRVFIAANDYNFDWAIICANIFLFNAAIVAKDYATAYTKFALVLSKMTEVGECRSDSVESLINDGNSIDGNTLGKLVLAKTGSFNAELINATPANITLLNILDGQEVIVILTESDGKEEFFDHATPLLNGQLLSLDAHKVVFICNYGAIIGGATVSVGRRLSISNKEIGGGIITAALNIEDNVPDAASFRSLQSVPYSTESAVVNKNASRITNSSFEMNWVLFETPVPNGYLIDISKKNDFSEFVTGYRNLYISGDNSRLEIDGLDSGTHYYSRIVAVKDGKKCSSYSNIIDTPTEP